MGGGKVHTLTRRPSARAEKGPRLNRRGPPAAAVTTAPCRPQILCHLPIPVQHQLQSAAPPRLRSPGNPLPNQVLGVQSRGLWDWLTPGASPQGLEISGAGSRLPPTLFKLACPCQNPAAMAHCAREPQGLCVTVPLKALSPQRALRGLPSTSPAGKEQWGHPAGRQQTLGSNGSARALHPADFEETTVSTEGCSEQQDRESPEAGAATPSGWHCPGGHVFRDRPRYSRELQGARAGALGPLPSKRGAEPPMSRADQQVPVSLGVAA